MKSDVPVKSLRPKFSGQTQKSQTTYTVSDQFSGRGDTASSEFTYADLMDLEAALEGSLELWRERKADAESFYKGYCLLLEKVKQKIIDEEVRCGMRRRE